MKSVTKRTAAFLGAAMGVAVAANGQSSPPMGFFDWDTDRSPGTYFNVSPFLSDNPADIANVQSALSQAQAKNRPLAVKVVQPLTSQAAKNIFNQFNVQYVFCDFEDTDAVTQTKTVANIVLNSSKSSQAFVGNWEFYPHSSDDTTRVNPSGTGQYYAMRGQNGSRTGNRMANEALYPGAPSFRNPAQGNSSAPNIRSALFTLPILSASHTTRNLLAGHPHIPWVTRFNNWGNTALDSDGNPSNGYTFDTSAKPEWNGQLPSRGDFQAQILHYRLRGATSVNMFEASVSSVVGYTRRNARDDIIAGWGTSGVANAIFQRKNFAFANLGSVVGVPSQTTVEDAGAIWSGVYDKAGGGTRRLAVLMSNLSDQSYWMDLPNDIGGFRTYNNLSSRTDDYLIDAGTHRLLTFTLSNKQWQLNSNTLVFSDFNRDGVGIPEPTTAALLGAGAMGLLIRRRRRAHA